MVDEVFPRKTDKEKYDSESMQLIEKDVLDVVNDMINQVIHIICC